MVLAADSDPAAVSAEVAFGQAADFKIIWVMVVLYWPLGIAGLPYGSLAKSWRMTCKVACNKIIIIK